MSDEQLAAELERRVRCERQATAAVLIHLAEFDARRLYLAAGFSSLFTYCLGVLRLSESEAYNRIEAARAARKWPRLLALLADGSLSLSTVRLIAPHLTEENQQERLGAACGRTKREVEELVARWCPRQAVAPLVRKVPAARPVAGTGGALDAPGSQRVTQRFVVSPEPAAPYVAPPAAAAAPAPPHPKVEPLSADAYQVRFTASGATRDKLRQVQDLLRHAIPDGDVGKIIDRALTVLLADLTRRKVGGTGRPTNATRMAAQRAKAGRVRRNARYIPVAVRRAAWVRDDGRCAFKGSGGRRCEETTFLQFHHAEPYGLGGEATPDNIELRCRAHNAYEGELAFGRRRP